MATSYTKNFNLGKQEEKTDKFSIDIINQNTDIIDNSLAKIAIKLDDTATLAEKLENEKANSDDIAKLSEDIATAATATALNRSTLGYQRKNLLENIGTTDTKNGVTFIKNGDDSITANGTAVGANATFRINNNFHLDPGRYVLSGCPQGGSGTGYRLQMSYLDYSFFGRDEGHGFIFEVSESAHFIISIIIQNGMTVSDLTFYPMLRYADITDDSYEPYQPSVHEQLTDILERLVALEGGEK